MARVLVIVPAYNEAETIAQVVQSIRAASPAYDVLVIDDGSIDNTPAIVRALPGAQLLRLPFNLGIGGCMQTGYKYAFRHGYDIAVQCDADGQHPPEHIAALIERVVDGSADVVVGSRFVADTGYVPPWGRRIGKSLLSRWVDWWIGGGITDTTSGFRAFNRSAMAVAATTYPEDYPEPEILVVLYKHGLKTVEIPVPMRVRQGGQSSINALRSAYYIVKVCLAILVDVFRRYAPAPKEV